MQISRTAGAGAHRELARDLGFAGGCEGGHLFVADVEPPELSVGAQGLGQAVEAVADDAIDALDAGLFQRVYDEFRDVPRGHDDLLLCSAEQ